MFKINFKIAPREDVYEGNFFKYVDKYYKITKVKDDLIYFTLPGTYKDGTLERDSWSGGEYHVSFMGLNKFEAHIKDKNYFLLNSSNEEIPVSLRDVKLE